MQCQRFRWLCVCQMPLAFVLTAANLDLSSARRRLLPQICRATFERLRQFSRYYNGPPLFRPRHISYRTIGSAADSQPNARTRWGPLPKTLHPAKNRKFRLFSLFSYIVCAYRTSTFVIRYSLLDIRWGLSDLLLQSPSILICRSRTCRSFCPAHPGRSSYE